MSYAQKLRFETKPNSSTLDQVVTWGPWSKPVRVVSIKAILIASALGAPERQARVEVLNVAQPMQQFLQSGGAPVIGTVTGTVAAYPGAGPSVTTTSAGGDVLNPYLAVNLPADLIILPGYSIRLILDSADIGDQLQDPVMALEELEVFSDD